MLDVFSARTGNMPLAQSGLLPRFGLRQEQGDSQKNKMINYQTLTIKISLIRICLDAKSFQIIKLLSAYGKRSKKGLKGV